jgi:hypothetical protein
MAAKPAKIKAIPARLSHPGRSPRKAVPRPKALSGIRKVTNSRFVGPAERSTRK